MSLRPAENAQKALISTTSRLVGEYESDGVIIAHAWANNTKGDRTSEGAMSRNAYVFAFNTSPSEEKSFTIPNHTHIADMVCEYLSVLFGKRFDHHGLLEGSGFYNLPDLSQFGLLCNHYLPQNSHAPRKDYSVPLNLTEVSRIEPLLYGKVDDEKFLLTFRSASKFYLQALQNVEHDPEVAYLHLITAGEILSNFHEYDKYELIDDHTRETLEQIRGEMSKGEKIANTISAKLLQVKRRYVKTIMQLVDANFFNNTEAKESYASLKKDTFEKAIAAAYDLRSKYVHTGQPFGHWVARSGVHLGEVQVGQPVVEDKDFSKIIKRAPTYIGLERVIRYCLLRFAQNHGAYLELDN